jgi:hypothetical protein
MRALSTALGLLALLIISAPSEAGVLKRIFAEEFGATW